jgi:hypothetical protein
MYVADEIKVGQIWQGGLPTGHKLVRIVKIGDQPKRRRITWSDIGRGFTITEYESTFRQDYSLKAEAQ